MQLLTSVPGSFGPDRFFSSEFSDYRQSMLIAVLCGGQNFDSEIVYLYFFSENLNTRNQGERKRISQ